MQASRSNNAAAVGGALSVILVWLATAYGNADIPAAVAAAIATVVIYLTSLVVKD